MDFHGSYRHAVRNLREGLRVFGGDFPATLQAGQNGFLRACKGRT